MITTEQARENYGFRDATEREDNLIMGLYHACEALFQSRGFLLVERTTPAVIAFLVVGTLAATLFFGLNYYALLFPVALSFIYIPKFRKSYRLRRENSGMLHIEKDQGSHFLIANGVCAEKTVGEDDHHRPVYTVKVRVAKNTFLDGVLVMKELFDQMETGNNICVMMADSPNAAQLIATPNNFMEIEVDKQRIGLKDFEVVDPRLVRVLTEDERATYIAQYEKQIELWRATYLRNYKLAALVGAVAVVLTYIFRSYNGLGLAGALLLSVPIMYVFSTKEHRNVLNFLKTAPELTGVETTVYREAGYKKGEDNSKSVTPTVIFKDSTGAILWHTRKTEDVKLFAPRDKVLMIIKGKELVPFHLNTAELPIQ